MSSFYDCFDDVMRECLAEFDERTPSIKLVRTTGRTMNPVTCELDAGTESEIDIVGVTVPYNNAQVDGTTIQTRDRRLVIDSQQAPLHDDKVLLDGAKFSIVNIQTFNPGGQIIGYELQLRS